QLVMRECVAAEALVAVDPKMEREEISTSVVGLEFSIEFRQLLAHSRPFRPVACYVTLSWSELKDWVGVRAQAGRIAPKASRARTASGLRSEGRSAQGASDVLNAAPPGQA
ncbi:MAG TPA: hypothetical protein VIF39_01325, partial [Hyphomicrobium sp.]